MLVQSKTKQIRLLIFLDDDYSEDDSEEREYTDDDEENDIEMIDQEPQQYGKNRFSDDEESRSPTKKIPRRYKPADLKRIFVQRMKRRSVRM